jgi:hypothetical protein
VSEETLETAARRVVRLIRIDDAKHGGLLSLDTIKAAETLNRQLDIAVAREKRRQEDESAEPRQS